MKGRGLPLLIFPMLGALLAWIFRPSEADWQTLEPSDPPRMIRKTLGLPGGEGLRFLAVPGTGGSLGLREVPEHVLKRYGGETASHAGASAFAAWLSGLTRQPLRLPTAAEWRTAARAGVSNAEFPWGFGPPVPPAGLHFALDSPPTKPGPAFGYGFRDLAGGRWEWTAGGLLLGSAWAERNPQTLYIDHQWRPPEGYAGADTGIRLFWEEESTDSEKAAE